jgi:hypothetical protein
VRYELPDGLTPDEERAVLAALEGYFASAFVRPEPWALAGRAEGVAVGALQIRNQSLRPWNEIGPHHYTRRGIETRSGRGDAK